MLLNSKIYYPSSASNTKLTSPTSIVESSSDIIVLIHGLTSAYQTFLNVLQPIADLTNLPVIGIDLRGHGASPESETGDYTIKNMAEDVAETLFLSSSETEERALKLTHLKSNKKVHILGHSWGSRIALQFAGDFPFCVKSVIVEDEFIRAEDFSAVARKNPPLSVEETNARFVEVREKWNQNIFSPAVGGFESEQVCSDFFVKVGGEPKRFGFEDYSRKIGMKQQQQSSDGGEPVNVYFPLFKPHVALTFDEYARQADMNFVWKNVEKYNFPILILCGDGEKNGADVSDADFKILSQEAESLSGDKNDNNKSPLRKVVKIEGAGHVVHRTHTDEFLKLFGEFIMSSV